MKSKKIKPYQWCMIAISFVLLFGGRYIPPVLGLTTEGMQGFCIFVGVILLMLFVSTSWPLAISIVAVSMGGLMSTQDALSASIGSSVTMYVLFATMLAYSLRKSGFLDRVAHWVVTRPFGKNHPWLYMSLMLAAPLVAGFFTDLMTNLIVFYEVFAKVFEIAGYKKGDKMPKLFFMYLILIDGMSCGATPISHVGTVFGMGLYEAATGHTINFASYRLWGVLFSFIFLAILILLLRFVFRMDVSGLTMVDVTKIERADSIRQKITKKEILNLVVFGVAVVLWILPGVLQFVYPAFYSFWSHLGTITPALMGCVLLALVHCDGEPLMDFTEAIKDGTAWGAVLLTGTVMLLVKLMGISELGIIDAFSRVLAPVTHGMNSAVFVVFSVGAVVLISNFCSNTVSNTLVYTLTVPLVLAGTIPGVNAVALTCVIAYGSAMAIATPAGSAYAGMMNGFGWFSSSYQLKMGMILSVIAALVISGIGYTLGTVILF